MIVYVTSYNSGPSWSTAESVYIVGIYDDIEKATEAVPEDFQRYRVRIESQYNNAQYRQPFKPDEGTVVRHWMADGWWYSVSQYEVR